MHVQRLINKPFTSFNLGDLSLTDKVWLVQAPPPHTTPASKITLNLSDTTPFLATLLLVDGALVVMDGAMAVQISRLRHRLLPNLRHRVLLTPAQGWGNELYRRVQAAHVQDDMPLPLLLVLLPWVTEPWVEFICCETKRLNPRKTIVSVSRLTRATSTMIHSGRSHAASPLALSRLREIRRFQIIPRGHQVVPNLLFILQPLWGVPVVYKMPD